LIDDMNATGTPLAAVLNVQKFTNNDDQLVVYSGTTPGQTPFALAACECYKTQVNAANLAYIAVGSHDPSLLCPLKGTSGSLSGTNYFTQPYHSTFDKADELLSDLNTNGAPLNCALNVQRFDPATDQLAVYTGSTPGQTPFDIVPGECYVVQVATASDCTWTPSHY
jgi:hypothetical protein